MTSLRPKPPDEGSPFSKRQERARKSKAIRTAASRRFNSFGVQGTRLEDISSDLGLTKTGITYYFASKDELAEDVFLSAVEFLEDAIAAALKLDASHADRILCLFRTYASQLTDALAGERAFPAQIKELDTLPEDAQQRIGERLNAAIEQVNELVKGWIGEGDKPIRRSEPVMFYLFALLDWLKMQADKDAGADFQLAADSVLDVLRDGLARAGAAEARLSARFSAPDELPQIFDRETRNRIKREAFIKAGLRYFNQYGFEGVSLADIAGSLGVTRGAFYYHIPDKETFLDQCFDHSINAVETTLESAGAELEGLAFLHRFLFDLIYMQASGVTPIIRMELLTALPDARQNRYRARLRNILRRLAEAYDTGIAEGQACEHDSDRIEALLDGVMFLNGGYTLSSASVLSEWRISENPQSATNDYLYALLHGLKA